MLKLTDIVKVYGEDESAVRALKGVSLNFRKSEFVSILGHSGCGKTTMLNIVGGLDRYTEGDLVINGVSTKDFTDHDWDTYRNHSVGFIFQSYNLIPHQSVLKNVELALTLSGVPREERRARAAKALEKVGLGDQLNKRPNQLSGGQMQRVAIARAIVNDPEIILADEPTGALDSETSVQVMDILKELAETKLVIMVTHNAELAEEYSTRIIRLSDGLVIGDTDPYEDDSAEEKTVKSTKKPSMSFVTAFLLSLNNLMTKKARTILTAFAGSIGIIGIALILSLSAGFNAYIQDIQRDTLSNYPVTITSTGFDLTGIMLGLMNTGERTTEKFPDEDKITSQDVIAELLSTVVATINTNDLKSFKEYIEENNDPEIINAISYSYGNLRTTFYDNNNATGADRKQLKPATLPTFASVMPSLDDIPADQAATISGWYYSFKSIMDNEAIFGSMIDNDKLIHSQYDLLEGSWPEKPTDAIIVVDQYNQISDLDLYMIGLMDDNDIRVAFYKAMLSFMDPKLTDEELDSKCQEYFGYGRSDIYYSGLDFSKLIGRSYKVVSNTEKFIKTGEVKFGADEDPEDNIKDFPLWRVMTNEEVYDYVDSSDATEINVVGVVRLKQNISAGCLNGLICYNHGFTDYLIDKINNLEIVKQQLAIPTDYQDGGKPMYFNIGFDKTQPVSEENKWAILEPEYTSLTSTLGVIDKDTPSAISIYPSSFEAKDQVIKIIEAYNSDPDHIDNKIKYNDYVGLIMSSVTTIINAVTYVLIAFVSISLVVSSIMIGIITYISVLERTKEIGVLRAMGASKHDVSRVFNAETFIIGLVSGVMGIAITLILNIPINMIIEALADLANVAKLPVWGGIGLIIISVILTTVAGLIPSAFAAKKDPVVALRTE